MICTSCGAPAGAPGQAFCGSCGSRLTPPAAPADVTQTGYRDPHGGEPVARPASPYAPPPARPPHQPPFQPPPLRPGPYGAPVLNAPTPATPVRRRRHGTVAAFVGLALVAAVVGSAGAVVMRQQGGGSAAAPTAATTAAEDDAARGEEHADRRAADSPSDAPTDSAEPTSAAAETISCWDGSTATSREECPAPTGVAGLVWVFGDSDAPGCQAAGGSGARVAEAYCYPSVAGTSVKVHYSQWRRAPAMRQYYIDQTVRPLDAPRADLQAIQVAASVPFKVAVFYRDDDAPWSATIYADSEEQYLAIVSGMAFRPTGDLRGVSQ